MNHRSLLLWLPLCLALPLAAWAGCGQNADVLSSQLGTPWAEGGAGGQSASALRGAGVVTTTALPMPSGFTNACEDPWTIRLLAYDPGPEVPRRMYFASCTPPGGQPKLLVSVSVETSADAGSGDGGPDVSGAVFEAELDASAGTLTPTGVERQFPECLEMHGIAAKSDCSVVGVLCRRATGSSLTDQPTKDMVAALPDAGQGGEQWWLTQPGGPDAGQTNDEEWLYEWPDGIITGSPSTYVAHKAIGGWEYGSQYLVYGETDDTYGLSLKATVSGGGGWHQGDAFLIVDRSSYSIDQSRGWFWGCAAGHTIFNHPTYNAATSQYAVTCGTDLGVNPSDASGYGGIWAHTEEGQSQGYLSVPIHDSITLGGGPTSLLPLSGGGYLGVLAGVDGAITPNLDFQDQGPVTSIGLARFDANGVIVGSVRSIAATPGTFLSYPQLAPLGNGAYLFGYGEMVALADQDTWDLLRVPAAYHVVEIDENGNALSEAQTLVGVGWGEQDQMMPLGDGRVGWAYTPSPARNGATLPPCASSQLALNVYSQK